MKTVATIAVVIMLLPISFASAAEVDKAAIRIQLQTIEKQIQHLQMVLKARVLGVSTSQLFTVTSNSTIVAQSYVPVTRAVADSWCADVVAMKSVQNTTVVCTHEGSVIYKK
ncbi:MAG: hypothetical protein KBB78_02305 [Candidatus Pacebacteria bacterium]|nr:hypothetical protein [Candidatus Paceibacterota bacterium]